MDSPSRKSPLFSFAMNYGHKVDVPKSNIVIIWTHVFEWYAVRYESKTSHHKDMCLKEIGLRFQIC